MTIRVCKSFRFEAAHRLRFHQGGCRNIHGHSYRVDVALLGDIPNERPSDDPATDMLLDFSVLSEVVNDILLEGKTLGMNTAPWDHSLFLHVDDPIRQVLAEYNVDHYPCVPVRIIPTIKEPTAEYFAELLASLIGAELAGRGVVAEVAFVRVWETEKAWAEWNALEQSTKDSLNPEEA